jgi:(R,R)-butanediol dehydrogenase/meso-butanediol dehydrogenase/diacetyl reductase
MKAALFCGPGDVRIQQIADPLPPGEGMVLVRIELCALCGTDVSQFQQPTKVPLLRSHEISGHGGPTVLGHEAVGMIEAIGPGVTELAVGQRVVPGSGWWCGACPQCRAGRPNICEAYYVFGLQAHGGMAEYVLYPAKMCVVVPAECTPEAAVLAQPCAVAIHALDRAKIEAGQCLALYGCGGIGSLLLAMLRARYHQSVTVFAVDVEEKALATARQVGAAHVLNSNEIDPVQAIRERTQGRGCQIAIEASGAPTAVKQALASIGRGGRMLQVGIPVFPVNMLLEELVTQEKEMVGTNGQICPTDLGQALSLLTTTDLAARINTTIIGFDDLVVQGLLPLAERRVTGKILVNIS